MSIELKIVHYIAACVFMFDSGAMLYWIVNADPSRFTVHPAIVYAFLAFLAVLFAWAAEMLYGRASK